MCWNYVMALTFSCMLSIIPSQHHVVLAADLKLCVVACAKFHFLQATAL